MLGYMRSKNPKYRVRADKHRLNESMNFDSEKSVDSDLFGSEKKVNN